MADFLPTYFRGLAEQAVTTIDMADAAGTLILSGTPTTGQFLITSNYLFVDPNSGQASEDLTLPSVSAAAKMMFFIFNTGGEGIVVKNAAAGTIITLDANQSGLVVSNGTTWYGFIGGIT